MKEKPIALTMIKEGTSIANVAADLHVPKRTIFALKQAATGLPDTTLPEKQEQGQRRRPLMGVPRRHNLHEVGMLQTSAQIVSTQSLPPEMGARFRFLGQAGGRCLPPGWL